MRWTYTGYSGVVEEEKKVLGVDISNVEKFILDILELQMEKMVLEDDYLFKISKGGDLKKRLWETLI